MATIKENYIIQKRNVLNEIRYNNLTLQELRFFSIYLSKINAKDISTRVVRFKLDDFKTILELNVRTNLHIVNVTDSLLSKTVNIPNERGGYEGFQLFKECRVDKNDDGEWYIEIDAHDKALPLMFEFKDKYFTYRLWNALRLKSPNQLRMYEILKQYQSIGYRILKVNDLKEMMGIGIEEYPRFDDFKTWVLNACQAALAAHTDIKFTYEPYGKKGKGGKILSLKFTIGLNEEYTDPLTLDMFIDGLKTTRDNGDIIDLNTIDPDDAEELLNAGRITPRQNRLVFLRGAVNDELKIEQIAVLYDIVIRDIPELLPNDQWQKLYHHFMAKYNYMKEKASTIDIKHPFGYLKNIIGSP